MLFRSIQGMSAQIQPIVPALCAAEGHVGMIAALAPSVKFQQAVVVRAEEKAVKAQEEIILKIIQSFVERCTTFGAAGG